MQARCEVRTAEQRKTGTCVGAQDDGGLGPYITYNLLVHAPAGCCWCTQLHTEITGLHGCDARAFGYFLVKQAIWIVLVAMASCLHGMYLILHMCVSDTSCRHAGGCPDPWNFSTCLLLNPEAQTHVLPHTQPH